MSSGSGQDAGKDGLGARVKRREDIRTLRGEACFAADQRLADGLHVAFWRSPIAKARILAVETEDAMALEGVVAVFHAGNIDPIGEMAANPQLEGVRQTHYPILAYQAVHAVGQPVVAVIATSRYLAEDALDFINVEFDEEEIPAIEARDGEANFHATWKTEAMSDAGAQDLSVDVTIRYPRLAPNPMEPRAATARWDSATGSLDIWLSSQTPHRARRDLARLIDHDPNKIRVISKDVGGAFGMKASLYPEEVFVAWAARKLGRSLRWVSTRGEDMLAASHGRGLESAGQLRFSVDGRFSGLSAEVKAPLGHWLTFSAAIPAWNGARILPGPYRVSEIDVSTSGFATNTAPVGIYRGAGRPEAAMLLERLVEKAARKLGIDPLELRRRNLLTQSELPHRTVTGRVLDSGDYLGALDRLVAVSDYETLRREQKDRRAAGEIVGIGTAFYVEPCGVGWETASITLEPSGRITVATGGSSQGHGRETAFSQITADAIGVSSADVSVLHGDTSVCPEGIGALASRSTAIGGSAVLKAARELRTRLIDVTASRTGVDPAAISLNADGATVDGKAVLSWTDLASELGPDDCTVETTYKADGEAWGYGACLTIVSIDPETGVPKVEKMICLDDAGVIVNPTLVEGQILGGIAQGLGEALMERLHYDETGQLLTGSLMDYAMPRAGDMPPIELHKTLTPSPNNALGAKGVGEAGTIFAPAALVNAVLDALAPFGVEDVALPMTSEVIWRALRDAQMKGTR